MKMSSQSLAGNDILQNAVRLTALDFLQEAGMRQNRTRKPQSKKKEWPVILGCWRRWILIAFAALRQRQPAASANGIRTARAETGSLSITVVGTGNLEYDDAEDNKSPPASWSTKCRWKAETW